MITAMKHARKCPGQRRNKGFGVVQRVLDEVAHAHTKSLTCQLSKWLHQSLRFESYLTSAMDVAHAEAEARLDFVQVNEGVLRQKVSTAFIQMHSVYEQLFMVSLHVKTHFHGYRI